MSGTTGISGFSGITRCRYPVEQLLNTKIHYQPNVDVTDPFGHYLDSLKGGKDLMSTISKGAKLFDMVNPGTKWAGHVAHESGRFCAGLSVVGMYGATERLFAAAAEGKVVDIAKCSLDFASCSAGAVAFFEPDRVTASALGGIAGTLKTVSDGFELASAASRFSILSNAKERSSTDPVEIKAGKEPITSTVKQGLDADYTATFLKIGKIALGLISGILSALAFVFKITLAKELLVAGAVAALGSVLFGVASELTKEFAPIQPVAKERLNNPLLSRYFDPQAAPKTVA